MNKLIRKATVVLFLILILATGLRLYHLGQNSIYYDEACSINYAEALRFQNYNFNLVGPTNIPPFYEIILSFWMPIFGSSEASARFPSLVFGLGAILAFFFLSKNLFGEKFALLSAFLLAISPIAVWYSQEARTYSQMLFFNVCMISTFERAIKTEKTKWWVVFPLFTLTALYSHPYSLFTSLCCSLYLIIRWKQYRDKAVRFLLSQTLALILFIPWVIFAFSNLSRTAGFPKGMNLMVILYTFYAFSLGFSVGPSVVDLHWNTSISAIRPYITSILPTILIIPAVSLLGIYHLIRKKEYDSFLWIAIFLLTPILIAFTISCIKPNISYNVRYVICALPFFIWLLSKGVFCLEKRGLSWLSILLLTIVFGYSLKNHYFDSHYAKGDVRSASKLMEEEVKKDDLVIVNSVLMYKPLLYYGFKHKGSLITFDYPSDDKLNAIREWLERKHQNGEVWLLLGRSYFDRKGVVKKLLDDNLTPIDYHHWPGVQVIHYRLSGRKRF